MKEYGLLREAWFIDGLRQGLGRSINKSGLIGFIGEFFNDKIYRGMEELSDGSKYEGYWKDDKPDGKGKCSVDNYLI